VLDDGEGVTTYCANAGSNFTKSLALHQSHNDEKRDGVHDSAHGDAVNEPLGERIPQAEAASLPRPLPIPQLHGITAPNADNVIGTAGLHLNVVLGPVLVAAAGARVGREGGLEKLLPFVIGGRADEGQCDEAQQFNEVEGEGCGFLVRVDDLGEDVGERGQSGCLQRRGDDRRRHLG
jgi:hypothetical protein